MDRRRHHGVVPIPTRRRLIVTDGQSQSFRNGVMHAPLDTRAFTLIEIIIVLVVMLLLTTVGVPLLSRFIKVSRVQETAQIVVTSLYRARAEAVRYRTPVAVFYGDDPSRYDPSIWLPPLSTVMPDNNKIELWTVKKGGNQNFNTYYSDLSNSWNESGIGDTKCVPYNPAGVSIQSQLWYPFYVRERPLTDNPITWPEGVRIVCGRCQGTTGVTVNFDFPDYRADSIGEIKRHNSVFAGDGSCPALRTDYCYRAVLIYDVSSGEHAIVEAGEWKAAAHPRILMNGSRPMQLTHIKGVALDSYAKLDSYLR